MSTHNVSVKEHENLPVPVEARAAAAWEKMRDRLEDRSVLHLDNVDDDLLDEIEAEQVIAIAEVIKEAVAAEPAWRPISTVPEDTRVLLYNELWGDTFGEVQIGHRQQGKWLFDGEMSINDLDEADLLDGEIAPEDYQPAAWMPLPSSLTSGEGERT